MSHLLFYPVGLKTCGVYFLTTHLTRGKYMTYEEAVKIYNNPAFSNMQGSQRQSVLDALNAGPNGDTSNAYEYERTVTQTPEQMGTTNNLTQEQMKTGRDLGIHTDAQGNPLDETSREQIAAGQRIYEAQQAKSEAVKDALRSGKPGEAIKTALTDKYKVAGTKQPASLDGSTNEEVKEEVEETIQSPQIPAEDKSKAYRQTRSVWQAWKDGEFGDPDSKDAKSARNYFILDSLASFASSQAAQSAQLANIYRGGSADTSAYDRPMSEWEAMQASRRENTLGNELSSETALNEAATNEQIANSFKSSPQSTQALQNLILEVQAEKTPEQLQVTIENMRKAGQLSDAQVAYLNKQVDWYDTNQAMGALRAILGVFR